MEMTVQIAWWLFLLFVLFGPSAAIVVWLCYRCPILEEMDDEEDRLQRIFLTAMHHRDQLDAVFNEICEIHKFTKDSVGYDEMIDVVYSGNCSYQEAMERIARLTNDRD
jgi:hypothetical protein